MGGRDRFGFHAQPGGAGESPLPRDVGGAGQGWQELISKCSRSNFAGNYRFRVMTRIAAGVEREGISGLLHQTGLLSNRIWFARSAWPFLLALALVVVIGAYSATRISST
jgi:hypothetical protein